MSDEPNSNVSVKPKSKFRQFSLRFFLFAVLVLSIPFIWIAHQQEIVKREADAIKALKAVADIRYYYDFHLDQKFARREPYGYKWLRALCGEMTFSRIAQITIYDTGDLKDLNELKPFEHLERVQILSVDSQLASLAGLEGKAKLRDLDVFHCEKIDDISQLSTLKNLDHLSIWLNAESDMGRLKDLHQLEHVGLSLGSDFKTLRKMPRLENVTKLWIDDCSLYSLNGLQAFPNLEELYLGHCELLENADSISDIENASSLKSLSLLGESKISSFAFLDKLTGLERLKVRAGLGFEVAPYTVGLKNLKELHIVQSKGFANMDWVKSLAQLQTLEIHYNPKLVNVDGLVELPMLRKFVVGSCENVDFASVQHVSTKCPKVKISQLEVLEPSE